jgi:tetratricopeptide (TPR) repeat protein
MTKKLDLPYSTKRRYVCNLIQNLYQYVSSKKILLIAFLLLSSISAGNAQENLSKKERKKQANKTITNRFFIEGTKLMALGDLEKSHFYFRKALDLSPEEPAINYKMAEVLIKTNQAKEALPFAEKAVKLDEDNKYYALMLAEIYSNLKQPLKSAEILNQLTVDGDKNQQYNLDLASIYLTAQEYEKALIVLDRAEGYYGILEPITVQKQRIYLRKNNLNKAVEEGERLIEARPGNANYVLNLVEILYNNNRLEQALELVLGEIDKYPNQSELQMAAYALLKEKGQLEQANVFLKTAFASPDLDPEVKTKAYSTLLTDIKTVEKETLLDFLETLMLEANPENAFVFGVMGERRMLAGENEAGMEYFKKSLLLNPKDPKRLEQVIVGTFGENSDFEETEKFTILGVDNFPQSAEFWFYDGVVKAARKKDLEAVASLQKALELNANKNPQLSQVAHGSLGSSLYNLGDKQKAFEEFEAALKLNPDDEQVLNNYAYFLSLDKQELEKAKLMSEKVVKKFPKNGTFLDTHAWVLFQMGDYEAAKKYMFDALNSETEPSGVMLEHYGDILYHLDEKAEALIYWIKAEKTSEKSDKLSQKIKEGKYYE